MTEKEKALSFRKEGMRLKVDTLFFVDVYMFHFPGWLDAKPNWPKFPYLVYSWWKNWTRQAYGCLQGVKVMRMKQWLHFFQAIFLKLEKQPAIIMTMSVLKDMSAHMAGNVTNRSEHGRSDFDASRIIIENNSLRIIKKHLHMERCKNTFDPPQSYCCRSCHF